MLLNLFIYVWNDKRTFDSILPSATKLWWRTEDLLGVPFSLEIIILAAWAIWITRNGFIFKGISPSLYKCRKTFKEELNRVVHRVNRKEYVNFKEWVQAFRWYHSVQLAALFSRHSCICAYSFLCFLDVWFSRSCIAFVLFSLRFLFFHSFIQTTFVSYFENQ